MKKTERLHNLRNKYKEQISSNQKAQDILTLAYDDSEEARVLFQKEIEQLIEANDYLTKYAIKAMVRLSDSNGNVRSLPNWAKDILSSFGMV